MKKLMIVIALLAPFAASALPLGNPWEASMHSSGLFFDNSPWCKSWGVRLGYYGDFVYDRHLKVDKGQYKKHIHRTKTRTNAAYLALNFWDRVDLFTTLGATHFHITSTNSAFGLFVDTSGFDFADIDTESHFSWSLGGRGTLWECGCFALGAEAQFFYTQPKIRYVATEDFITVYPSNVKLKYRDWQIGLGAAYRINIAGDSTALIPYAGVKWGHAKVTMGNTPIPALNQPAPAIGAFTLFDLKNERHWGWAVGLTLLGCNKTSITVEGRYADEKALYVNGQLRF